VYARPRSQRKRYVYETNASLRHFKTPSPLRRRCVDAFFNSKYCVKKPFMAGTGFLRFILTPFLRLGRCWCVVTHDIWQSGKKNNGGNFVNGSYNVVVTGGFCRMVDRSVESIDFFVPPRPLPEQTLADDFQTTFPRLRHRYDAIHAGAVRRVEFYWGNLYRFCQLKLLDLHQDVMLTSPSCPVRRRLSLSQKIPIAEFWFFSARITNIRMLQNNEMPSVFRSLGSVGE